MTTMTCFEPDAIDELYPPEVAVLHASEELYVKAFSIAYPQIDLRYVRQAAETLRLVIEKIEWNESSAHS